MCDYCKTDTSGDLIAKDIFYSEQPGIFGAFKIYAYVQNDRLHICANVGQNDPEVWSPAINYCPMCGRKL